MRRLGSMKERIRFTQARLHKMLYFHEPLIAANSPVLTNCWLQSRTHEGTAFQVVLHELAAHRIYRNHFCYTAQTLHTVFSQWRIKFLEDFEDLCWSENSFHMPSISLGSMPLFTNFS